SPSSANAAAVRRAGAIAPTLGRSRASAAGALGVADLAEVGAREAVPELEPVPEEPVDADVEGPHEPDERPPPRRAEHGDDPAGGRPEVAVHGVVRPRAEGRAVRVADHREVEDQE